MSGKFGVYDWSYAGGTFEVALRPNNTFYCAKYPAQSSFAVTDSKLYVDFGKYGQYEFSLGNPDLLEGSLRGDPSKWRKLAFKRDFNETETAILGAGFGSVWNFEWEKGAFEIELRVDGYNHFICPTYPAHSHWDLSEDQTLHINWAQYGEYDLRLDAASKALVGFKKGQPDNWRRATFLRPIAGGSSTQDIPSHDHAHVHAHGDHEACSHSH